MIVFPEWVVWYMGAIGALLLLIILFQAYVISELREIVEDYEKVNTEYNILLNNVVTLMEKFNEHSK